MNIIWTSKKKLKDMSSKPFATIDSQNASENTCQIYLIKTNIKSCVILLEKQPERETKTPVSVLQFSCRVIESCRNCHSLKGKELYLFSKQMDKTGWCGSGNVK